MNLNTLHIQCIFLDFLELRLGFRNNLSSGHPPSSFPELSTGRAARGGEGGCAAGGGGEGGGGEMGGERESISGK